MTRTRDLDAAARALRTSAAGCVRRRAAAPRARRALAAGSTRSRRSPTASGVLQHRELTDAGPQLCRSENFVPVHAGLRELLCDGSLARGRGRAARRAGRALQGEDQLQAPRRRRLLAAPGRAGVPDDRRATCRRWSRSTTPTRPTAASRSCRAASTRVLPARRARVHRARRSPSARLAAGAGARRAARSGSTAARPHRSGPNRSSRPRRALYPTYNAAREGDLRAEYYADEARRVRGGRRPATARGCRSSATSKGGRREGRVHRRSTRSRRATSATEHTPVLHELARAGGRAPSAARAR